MNLIVIKSMEKDVSQERCPTMAMISTTRELLLILEMKIISFEDILSPSSTKGRKIFFCSFILQLIL